MKQKNGYPPISAYRTEFGSWENSINAMLDAEIDNLPCDNNIICYPYQLDKYTMLCTRDMELLWTQFPKLSMEVIATIYNTGYSRGCDSMIENVCISTLYDLYL